MSNRQACSPGICSPSLCRAGWGLLPQELPGKLLPPLGIETGEAVTLNPGSFAFGMEGTFLSPSDL